MKRNKNFMLQLAKTNNNKNRKNTTIMIIVVAMVIFGIFSVFTLLIGKIQIDSQKMIQENGSIASGMIINGEEEQFLELHNLSYITDIGKVKKIGVWIEEKEEIAQILICDETTFQNFYLPAYTNVVGNYPKASNEIMVSRSVLKRIGIDNPQIGMEISSSILWDDWTKNEEGTTTYPMCLSGYFTEYMSGNVPVYFSEEFLEASGMSQQSLNILFRIMKSGYSRDDIESQITKDLDITDQQKILALDSNERISLENTFGGYGIASICGLILLISMLLLIYNLMVISISDALPNIKIMRSIGMTRKQVIQMLRLQNLLIIGRACIIGAFLSLVAGYGIYPIIMKKVLLNGYESALLNVSLFSWQRLFCITFLVFVMAWGAGGSANSSVYNNRQTVKIKKYKKRTLIKQGKEKFYLLYLAWHNITRVKKRFCLMVGTITIGCIVVLCSEVIFNGSDAQNRIEQNSDFSVSVTETAMNEYQWEWDESKRQQFHFISDEMIHDIASIAEIKETDIFVVEGGFGSFDYGQESLQPLVNANSGNIKTNTDVTIQSVNKATLDIINKYVNDNEKRLDYNLLASDNGVLILHNHMLSLEQEAETYHLIGKSINVMDLHGEMPKELRCSGYLDVSEKNFPKIDMTWHPQYTNYFIVSDNTFETLGYEKYTFSIFFDVEKKNEPKVKKALLQYLQTQNKNDIVKYYELSANSDVIQKQEEYFMVSRIVMTLVCSTLLGIAILNYVNTIFYSILIRKKEFEMMNNIGMEQKQICKMLIYEGLLYSIASILGIVLFGNISIFLLIKILSLKISFFAFTYPLKELIIIVTSLTILCVIIPVLCYLKYWIMNKNGKFK